MPEATPTDPGRYEDVRRKLLERGYLGGPIERFLLKELFRSTSPARRLIRAAVKAAVVGAPILGGTLAVAAVAANWPLLGPADALVVWIWFGVLAGAALVLLDLAAAWIVTGLARRRGARPSDRHRAALLVGLPTLFYVLLLWWERKAGAGLVADLVFLASAVGATLLVAWLAGIVSLAGIIGKTGEVPDRGRRPILLVAVVATPLAAVILVLPEARAPSAGRPSSAFALDAGAPRLLLVGIDGLDASLVQVLADRGAVDGLLGAMARGAVHPKRREAGPEPPEVWTTIVTGVAGSEHGVRSVGAERLPGVATPLQTGSAPFPLTAALRFVLPARTVPVTGAGRSVLALWEIVGLREPAVATGWWASWPARAADGTAPAGYVVSDRALPKLLSGSPEDRDVAPESLWVLLEREFPADRDALRKQLDERFPGGAGGDARPLAWESILIDGHAWRATSRLSADPAVRAAFVYLPGLDILRHRIESRATGAASIVETQAVLEGYVRWLDGLVAEAASRAPSWSVIVVADPGRAATPASEGFVAVLDPRVRPGCVGPPIGDRDVAPLALWVAGFPASAEMRGKLPRECLEPGIVVAPAVPTFGRRRLSPEGTRSEYDPEMIRRLESLGYLR